MEKYNAKPSRILRNKARHTKSIPNGWNRADKNSPTEFIKKLGILLATFDLENVNKMVFYKKEGKRFFCRTRHDKVFGVKPDPTKY